MNFVKFDIVTGEDGKTVRLPINADQVCMLTAIPIPTGLKGPGDVTITKPGTGIDMGIKTIPVVGTIEEVQERLEGVETSNRMLE